jgi:hypothetical protein
MPPRGRYVPVEIHWAFGFYASALVSLLAAGVSLVLGGSLPPLPEPREKDTGSTLDRRTLH